MEALAIRVRKNGEYVKNDDSGYFVAYGGKTYKLTSDSITEAVEEEEVIEGNSIIITYDSQTLEITPNLSQTWYEWATDTNNADNLTLTNMDSRYPNKTLKDIITQANNTENKDITYFRDDLWIDGNPIGTHYPAASCYFYKNARLVKTTDVLSPGEYTVETGNVEAGTIPSSGIFPLWLET